MRPLALACLLGVLATAHTRLVVPCGEVLLAADAGFANATRIDNEGAAANRKPAVVVLAACAADVVKAIVFARAESLSFQVKGGGHSAAGDCLAPGELVLDMSRMNESKRSGDALHVEAGAIFGDLYSHLDGTGWLLAGGGCSTVGVAGFVLGGGLSFLSRAYGLASDNLLSLELVTADGRGPFTVSATDPAQAELFWALRGGGGGNFGVVTKLTMQLHASAETQVKEVCWHGPEQAAAALPRYAAWLEADEAAGGAHPSVGAPALLLREHGKGSALSFCVTFFTVEGVDVTAQLQSLVTFTAVGSPSVKTDGCGGAYPQNFFEWESRCGTTTVVAGDDGYVTSGVLLPGALDDGFARKLVRALVAAPGERTVVNFHDGGGAIRDADPGASAFAHRGFNLIYQVKAIWTPSPTAKVQNMKWATTLKNALTPSTSGAYVNYIDPLLDDWQVAYYGVNYYRLEAVKRAVDPTNMFAFAQSIGANDATAAPRRRWSWRHLFQNLLQNCHWPWRRHSTTAPLASVKAVLTTPFSPAVAPTGAFSCDGALAQMHAFQAGQNSMDSAALAALYTPDGTNFIPASVATASATGRAEIMANFQDYFETLASIKETVVGPILLNGNVGALSKRIVTVTKPNITSRNDEINWFEFDCSVSPPLISSLHALFGPKHEARSKDNDDGEVTTTVTAEELGESTTSSGEAVVDATTTPSPTVAPTASCDSALAHMHAFQAGQISMDSAALAALYTPDGTNFIPASVATASATGRAEIMASFSSYFETLASIKETVVGPILLNGNVGAFLKHIVAVTNSNVISEYDVINWFEFDCSVSLPLISSFHALFNPRTTERKDNDYGEPATTTEELGELTTSNGDLGVDANEEADEGSCVT